MFSFLRVFALLALLVAFPVTALAASTLTVSVDHSAAGAGASVTITVTAPTGSTLATAPDVSLAGSCVPSATISMAPTATAGSYSGSYTVPGGSGDCSVQISANATDTTGAALSASTSFLVDRTPPTANVSTSAQPGPSGWYTTPVWVTLTASDGPGSGVAVVYAGPSSTCSPSTVNGCQPFPSGSAQIYVSGDGTFSYSGFAVDNAGNVSAPVSTTVRLDTTGPTTSSSLSGPNGTSSNWFSGPVTLTLAATDAGSGVASIQYTTDNGTSWQPYSSVVSLSQAGYQTVLARSTDNAGNVGASTSVSFGVDTAAPTFSLGYQGPSNASGWYSGPASVFPDAQDSGSGVKQVLASVDGGAATVLATGAGVTVSTDGKHTVVFTATDMVGNTSTSPTAYVNVDTTAPTVPGSVKAAAGQTTGSIGLSWTAATDAGSGVAKYVIVYQVRPSTGCPAATLPYGNNGYGNSTVGNVTSATLTGLQRGSVYCVAISAVDAAGNQGGFSAPVVAKAG